MLLTYFTIGLALAIPELVLVYNCDWLRRFIERSPIIELIFSLLLSMLIGATMGIGSGVTFAVANVFSTMITLFVYKFKVVERCGVAKSQVVKTWTEVQAIVHVVSAPFRFILWLVRQINRLCARGSALASEASNKVKALRHST